MAATFVNEIKRQDIKTLHLTGGLAQLGGKVFARTVVRPLTVGVSPNCVLLNPQLRQAARALSASGQRCGESMTKVL
jgi:hypothetical protein